MTLTRVLRHLRARCWWPMETLLMTPYMTPVLRRVENNSRRDDWEPTFHSREFFFFIISVGMCRQIKRRYFKFLIFSCLEIPVHSEIHVTPSSGWIRLDCLQLHVIETWPWWFNHSGETLWRLAVYGWDSIPTRSSGVCSSSFCLGILGMGL